MALHPEYGDGTRGVKQVILTAAGIRGRKVDRRLNVKLPADMLGETTVAILDFLVFDCLLPAVDAFDRLMESWVWLWVTTLLYGSEM